MKKPRTMASAMGRYFTESGCVSLVAIFLVKEGMYFRFQEISIEIIIKDLRN